MAGWQADKMAGPAAQTETGHWVCRTLSKQSVYDPRSCMIEFFFKDIFS